MKPIFALSKVSDERRRATEDDHLRHYERHARPRGPVQMGLCREVRSVEVRTIVRRRPKCVGSLQLREPVDRLGFKHEDVNTKSTTVIAVQSSTHENETLVVAGCPNCFCSTTDSIGNRRP